MRTSEIRKRWLDYFALNDHEICPSVPLVSPDPSILFTIAGVVPFIPYIIGTEPAPWPRAASVQKCIRTNDIDNVGRTTRHGTFFQMNGNFSFGDYFKEGAIGYAWDLLTGSVNEGKYGLDGDRMWVTIWEKDDEAYDLITKKIGLDPKHIVRLPRDDIFWDTGQPGPAGPCAEWHYDRGPDYGPEAVGGTVDPGGDRYLEVWNLVFDQYLRGEGVGKDYPLLAELEYKAIDTGAGLERLSFVLQDKANMYEIDEVFPVIAAAEELSGKKYPGGNSATEPVGVHMRVVADHVRSALMLITDGVRPSNEGRGYVLRRLVRRAVRSMRLLGVDEPCLPYLLPVSRDAMAPSYPEVMTEWDRVCGIAYGEEDAFRRTLTAGTTILDTAVAQVKKDAGANRPVLSGKSAFSLHDTYGFPIDLTLEMAEEQGVSVDEKEFRKLMQEQKARARADAVAKKAGHVDSRVYHEFLDTLGQPVTFLGYTESVSSAKVMGILVDGKPSPVAQTPAEVDIILDQTPFYAEMGGQLADHGVIRLAGGGVIEVHDVQAPIKGLSVHRGSLVEGDVHLDEAASAEIDTERRMAIARAHTATHMMHKALHETLGNTATQAGSENSPSRMRLDFRWGSAVPGDALVEIEERINSRMAENLEVVTTVMPLEEAKAQGATALFGEKYGKDVRVVSIDGDWSKELCGGTHVPQTGQIGRLALLSESSIGSGLRRVDALVGDGAYSFQAKEHALVSQLSALLGGRPEDLPEQVSVMLNRLKQAEKALSKVRMEKLLEEGSRLVMGAKTIGKVRLAAATLGEVDEADAVRQLVLDMRGRLGEEAPVVAAVGAIVNSRPMVVVATNAQARELGVRAGELVKLAASRLGGGGGGKDDLAQGGGTNVQALGGVLEDLARDIAEVTR